MVEYWDKFNGVMTGISELARMIKHNPEVREYVGEAAANADVYMVLEQLLGAFNDAFGIDDK